MTLQPRFGQGMSEKIPQLYSIASEVRPVTGPVARLSLFTPSAHLDFHPPWFRLPSGTAISRALCGRSSAPLIMYQAQSIALHDVDDIWAVELPIEFEVVPTPVHTVYYFWAIYRAENLPLKDEYSVLFPFCQHPHFFLFF
jgi:hypothetical protein